eukprot:TRINITY_DN8708_c0_g2_i1.p1 TRINITY_DN8708_c0_g2~~TRINITY_DN8708_c0_g2_i1.p1  ORF type:complete len:309 (-),score=28.24 TRINITY_DN8708_c0_g2_i1:8-934(-)
MLLPFTIGIKKPPLSLLKRMLSTGRYPTIASSGDPNRIIYRLPQQRIATMMIAGVPNRPFPAETGVALEDMTEGGIQAINFVTTCIQTEDWQSLEGLVSDECIQGLQKSMNAIPYEDRGHIAVNPRDVFFHFIPQFQFTKDKQKILLVTFSMPRVGELKEVIKQNKEMTKSIADQVKKDVENGTISRAEFPKVMQEKMAESLKVLSEKGMNTDTIFKENDIIIGNYTFQRDDVNQQWTIVEIAQADSRNVWQWFFHKRWKGRLGISLRTRDFNTVLRFDYITDFLGFMLVYSLLGGMLGGGGMMKPHS